MTKEEIERLLRDNQEEFLGPANFDYVTQIALIVVFSTLILFGATGNGLVCYVVARNPHMRTPRNIFIINLAISDLTLCLFTQPFNLMKASMQQWHLGAFMCKFVPMFAGTNVFVSTISITAIALDRFQVIVYPTKESMMKVGSIVALVSIWLISFLMASPLLVFNVTEGIEIFEGIVLYEVCVENPELPHEKGAYSVASMIFQYIVPILIVTVAHARICFKLKYRMVNQQQNRAAATSTQSTFMAQKKAAERRRKRKTNIMLVTIAVVFACSWMPLNVFNIMADFNPSLLQRIDKRGLIIPLCHLLVLTSACINPVLYGWLNENFRKEFMRVLSCCRRRQTRQQQQQQQQQQRNVRHQHNRGHVNASVEETLPFVPAATSTAPTAMTSVYFDNKSSVGKTEVVDFDVHEQTSLGGALVNGVSNA